MSTKAEHLTEQALSQIRGNLDAIPTLSAAIAQLKIEAGEMPAEEMEDYLCECSDEICPFEE